MRRDGEPAILCVGPSHKTASLAARERFALVGEAAERLTRELVAHPDVLEVVGVTTCNRSELYMVVTDVDLALPFTVAALANLAGADAEQLFAVLAVRVDDVAVRHLLRVAAGVESAVVGEAEIQGQLRQAFDTARAARTCGPVLDRLFRTALETGKRARTDTAIGSGRMSLGSIATELLAGRLGDLADRKVVVVGAGGMGSLAARSLRHRGVGQLVVLNRSATRASELATDISADTTSGALDELERHLVDCDALVTSTTASGYVVTRELVERALRQRGGQPLVVVDLAVPRDVEPEVGALVGCQLFDLDDLEHTIATSRQVREAELDAVGEIVDSACARFLSWRRQQAAVPAIVAMRTAAEAIRIAELERFERRHGHLAPEDRRRVEQLTRSIVNQLLHAPTVQLRELARGAHEAPTVVD
jgi:glutamyl-tRNA reductase